MPLSYLQKEKINAMKNKDVRRKNVLSEIIDTCQKAVITPKGRLELTEQIVNESLIKYQKMVQEMIDTCPGDRVETLDEYKKKMVIIKEFAPQLITDEEEIKKKIYHILAVTDIQQDGKSAVMKAVMPKLKGKVDMKIANKVLSEILVKSGEL